MVTSINPLSTNLKSSVLCIIAGPILVSPHFTSLATYLHGVDLQCTISDQSVHNKHVYTDPPPWGGGSRSLSIECGCSSSGQWLVCGKALTRMHCVCLLVQLMCTLRLLRWTKRLVCGPLTSLSLCDSSPAIHRMSM